MRAVARVCRICHVNNNNGNKIADDIQQQQNKMASESLVNCAQLAMTGSKAANDF